MRHATSHTRISFLFYFIPLLLVLATTTNVISATKQASNRTGKAQAVDYDYSKGVAWTVVLKSKTQSPALRLNSNEIDVMVAGSLKVLDKDKHILTGDSVRLKWHYPSGTPWFKWASSFLPNTKMNPLSDSAEKYIPKHKVLRAEIHETAVSTNVQKNALDIYYIMDTKDRDPKNRPQYQGLVFNGRAKKYINWSQGEVYLIQNYRPRQGAIITCSSPTVVFCTLRGSSVSPRIAIRQILIPRNDLKNWRRYEKLAKALVRKRIIKTGMTGKTQ